MDRFHYLLIFMILLVIISNLAIVGQGVACNCKCSNGKCISGSSTAKCPTNCRCNTDCDCCLPCCPSVVMPGQPPCCYCSVVG